MDPKQHDSPRDDDTTTQGHGLPRAADGSSLDELDLGEGVVDDVEADELDDDLDLEDDDDDLDVDDEEGEEISA
jgi:hypothetical protein